MFLICSFLVLWREEEDLGKYYKSANRKKCLKLCKRKNTRFVMFKERCALKTPGYECERKKKPLNEARTCPE